MNKLLCIIALISMLLYAMPTFCKSEVIVVPLGSSKAKGSNQQVQYNDNSKTAGAAVYYDKTNRRLEARGEVLTTNDSGAVRLWGEGRPGVTASGWTPSSTTGIQVASGNVYVTWEGVAAGCPKHTWVCTLADRGTNTASTPDDNHRCFEYFQHSKLLLTS